MSVERIAKFGSARNCVRKVREQKFKIHTFKYWVEFFKIFFSFGWDVTDLFYPQHEINDHLRGIFSIFPAFAADYSTWSFSTDILIRGRISISFSSQRVFLVFNFLFLTIFLKINYFIPYTYVTIFCFNCSQTTSINFYSLW